ncbi:MAG: PorT family protein [Bacteroidales bacterium]|nr:PorT family protein [Bacteroidales bacterium]
MKKSIVIIILVLFHYTCSFCQVTAFVYAGPDYSLLYESEDIYYVDTDPRVSVMLGAGIKTCLIKNLSLLSTLTFKHLSSFVEASFGGVSHSGERQYNLGMYYISISILPQYSYGNKIGVFINCGPYVATLIRSTMHGVSEYSVMGNMFNGSISRNASDLLKRFDYGLSGGIGLHFKIKGGLSLLPQIRYDFGLFVVGKEQSDELEGYKVRSLSLLMQMDF